MVILQLDEQPSLVQAIFCGDAEEVRHVLEIKPDVNTLDTEKRSPLHAAAFKGDATVASLLLSHGARVNTMDSKWLTPLHRACGSSSEEMVSLLLMYQADVISRDRYWQTPLHIAAANNAVECVTLLLDYVPNANITDRSGRTALHHAAFNGHSEIVTLLISRGCIVNACDKKDCRPLHYAAHMGHVEIVEILLRSGADINAKDRNQYSPLHVAAASGMLSVCRLLLNEEAQVDIQNSYGNTPLHIACLNGHLPICEELVAFKADTEALNYRGQTPLHISAASTHGVECLNFLLEYPVNINRQSSDGRTPLHMTAIHGRFTRSKTLIDKGAIVDCVDKTSCTALHIAAQYGHDLLSNTLLSFGADPSAKGYEGRTPLHMCCLSGFVECCRKFLQAGVNLDARDDWDKTATHCAAYKGSVECLDLLVSHGANFQLIDKIGRIPLHYAAVQGHYPCVFTLVGMGSPVNLQDAEGCSPLHLAAAYDTQGTCVEYLLQHKSDPKLKDVKGFTPIHYAVAGENFIGLGYLLTAVGNNYIMYGNEMPLTTPLHLAAQKGNLEILRLILPYFHDTNIRTECGSTSLLLSAREGHPHCVQMLLRFGAKVAICDNTRKMGPVHYSARNGHTHCLALLVDNTEDRDVIELRDSLQRTPLMLAISGGHTESAITLLKSRANPNVVDADQHSALFRAVVHGQHIAVKLLLLYKAEVSKPDVNGKTVLHLAAACGHLSSLQTILKSLSPEEIEQYAFDNQKCTALHWACYNGNPSCVAFLLEKDVFKKFEGNSFSPVHCATYAGSERCIQLLCSTYGAEIVKLKDERNRTPLHIAALHGHVDCAKFLLEQGAESDCQDLDSRTPLVAAAQNGQSQIIELLIAYKADVTSYDNNGNTALHLACLKKHSHSALLLLEHISDAEIINMINNERKTPLHLAARNGLVNVTRQLISKGSSVLAVDANGMTPALCCAPNNNVAQCLSIILTNYPNLSTGESSTNSKNDPAFEPFPILQYETVIKIFDTRGVQTKITLSQNPDRFEIENMFKINLRDSSKGKNIRIISLEKLKSKLEKFPESITLHRHPMIGSAQAESVYPVNNNRSDNRCFIIENYRDDDRKGREKRDEARRFALDLHKSRSDTCIKICDSKRSQSRDRRYCPSTRSGKNLFAKNVENKPNSSKDCPGAQVDLPQMESYHSSAPKKGGGKLRTKPNQNLVDIVKEHDLHSTFRTAVYAGVPGDYLILPGGGSAHFKNHSEVWMSDVDANRTQKHKRRICKQAGMKSPNLQEKSNLGGELTDKQNKRLKIERKEPEEKEMKSLFVSQVYNFAISDSGLPMCSKWVGVTGKEIAILHEATTGGVEKCEENCVVMKELGEEVENDEGDYCIKRETNVEEVVDNIEIDNSNNSEEESFIQQGIPTVDELVTTTASCVEYPIPLIPDVSQDVENVPKQENLGETPNNQQKYYKIIQNGLEVIKDTKYVGCVAEYIQIIVVTMRHNPKYLPEFAEIMQNLVEKIKEQQQLEKLCEPRELQTFSDRASKLVTEERTQGANNNRDLPNVEKSLLDGASSRNDTSRKEVSEETTNIVKENESQILEPTLVEVGGIDGREEDIPVDLESGDKIVEEVATEIKNTDVVENEDESNGPFLKVVCENPLPVLDKSDGVSLTSKRSSSKLKLGINCVIS